MTLLITTALLRENHACNGRSGECYSDERLAEYGFDEGIELIDLLQRKGRLTEFLEGRPDKDLIWVATRPGVLSEREMASWLARIVGRALKSIPEPDPRSLAVVEMLKKIGSGETVSPKERKRIWAAARSAEWTEWAAARSAEWAAEWAAEAWAAAAAARSAEGAAEWAAEVAWAAAAAAEWAARSAAEWAAASWAAECKAQVEDLITVLRCAK